MNRIHAQEARKSKTDKPRVGGLFAKLRQIWASIPRSWLVSYLAVLLLPLLVSQSFYIFARELALQNAVSASSIALEQTSASINRIFQDIRGLGQELLTRQEVASLQYAAEISDTKKLKLAELRRELSLKLNFSGSVSRVALYFPRSGAGISSEGYFDTAERLETELSQEWGLSLTEIVSTAARPGDFHLIVKGEGENGPAAQLYAVMQTRTGNTLDTLLLFELNADQFKGLLASGGEENEPVIWLSTKEGLLLYPDGLEGMDELIETCRPYLDAGTESDAISQQSLVLCQAETGFGWQIYSATSTAAWAGQLGAIRNAYFGYLAVCLLLGGAASLVLTQRNFSPVRRLAERLQKGSGSTEQGFDALEKSLNQLLQREQDYERELRLRKQSMLPAAVAGLMKGTVAGRQGYLDACREYGLAFSGSRFGAIGIWIADYSDLFFDGKAGDDEKALDLSQYVVTQVTEELVREACPAYICLIDGRLYALLSAPDGEEEAVFADRLAAICGRAENYIRTRLGIRLHYYITALYGPEAATDEPFAIRAAYDEAAWGLEQLEGFKVEDPVAFKRTLCWEQLPLSETAPADFSAQTLARRQFIAATEAGDFDEADRLYRTLRQQGLFQLDRSFSVVRAQTLILFDLLVTSLLNSRQLHDYGNLLGDLSARMSAARDIQTLDALARESEETVYRLCHTKEGPEDESYGEKVNQYIGQHFSDPELTVTQIADHFGVSSSYLLRVYKKDCGGSGISDSIHRRRVDEAKILLRTTGDTISDIAVRVGYGNSLALIRAFKRLEAMTPTAYRKAEKTE